MGGGGLIVQSPPGPSVATPLAIRGGQLVLPHPEDAVIDIPRADRRHDGEDLPLTGGVAGLCPQDREQPPDHSERGGGAEAADLGAVNCLPRFFNGREILLRHGVHLSM